MDDNTGSSRCASNNNNNSSNINQTDLFAIPFSFVV